MKISALKNHMILNTKLFALNKLFKLVNRQNIAQFSCLYSNKLNIVKCKGSVSLFSFEFKRQNMNLTSVIKIFEERVPPYLAENWDNAGLLIEPSNKATISTILFTNDLTEAVLEEAISIKSDLIISYHPPIFAAVKALKQSNWKDRIVCKCLEHSIAVYSPHTSCDAVDDGVNDWLIGCFVLSDCHPIHTSYEKNPKYSHIVEFSLPPRENYEEIIFKQIASVPDSECHKSINSDCQWLKVKVNQTSLNQLMKLIAGIPSSISVSPLNPLPIPACGMGRIGKLSEPLVLGDCIKLVKNHLKLDFIRFALSVSHSLESVISTVAVCAGSGSGVLKGISADLYITGEMSHHDILDANHRNVSVVLCEHSNSERGYLKHLAEALSPKLSGVKLHLSSSDKEPISIM